MIREREGSYNGISTYNQNLQLDMLCFRKMSICIQV